MTQRHEVTYQGYVVEACEWRRSAGLVEERGYVDIRFEILKKIAVFPKQAQWRSANKIMQDSQSQIEAWAALRSTITVEDLPAIPAPGGGGLAPFGDLVIKTLIDDVESPGRTITYKDVFVDYSGIEELTEDLAEVEEHNRGIVRVPITDIRRYYADKGAVLQQINWRRKAGAFDPRTINGSVPWTLSEVLGHLFNQLPGCPAIVASDFSGLPSPMDIEGRGEPVVEVIGRILEQAGLEAMLQPDNNYVVRKKSVLIPQGTIVSSPGNARVRDASDNLVYEKKTVTLIDRPALVQVLGLRRIRRGTFSYVPVVKTEKGLWMRLQDWVDLIGYSMEALNKQVLAREKNFNDVPPEASVSGSDARLHARRVEILREHAYKSYAPAFLFDSETGPFPTLTDSDFEIANFLPVYDPPYTDESLESLMEEIPGDDAKIEGSLGPWRRIPPVVRGCRVSDEMIVDLRAYTRRFGEQLAGLENSISTKTDMVDLNTNAVNDLKGLMTKAEASLAQVQKLTLNNSSIKDASLALDVLIAEREIGLENHEQYETYLTTLIAGQKRALVDIETDIAHLRRQIAEERAKRGVWLSESRKIEVAYKEYLGGRGVQAIANVPYGIIDNYSIDRQTGIVQFAEPACHMKEPLLINGENGTVIQDGSVSVVWGYELNTNSVEDYTSILFSCEDKDESPDVFVVGANRSSPIAAHVERAPSMRIYETELGTPFNLGEVVTEAAGKAVGIFKPRRVVEGFAAQYMGVVKCVLDSGISSVQHVYDGDTMYTWLMQNSPNARGGLGPANAGRRLLLPNLANREALGAEIET